jgi:hypothetical protein
LVGRRLDVLLSRGVALSLLDFGGQRPGGSADSLHVHDVVGLPFAEGGDVLHEVVVTGARVEVILVLGIAPDVLSESLGRSANQTPTPSGIDRIRANGKAIEQGVGDGLTFIGCGDDCPRELPLRMALCAAEAAARPCHVARIVRYLERIGVQVICNPDEKVGFWFDGDGPSDEQMTEAFKAVYDWYRVPPNQRTSEP